VRIIQHTAKLTFSHDFSIKVWGACYTSVRTIFKFVQYTSYSTNCFKINICSHFGKFG